jgi:hypothetical protein
MKWVMERDLLIAQTMAFVQSVTGKKPEIDVQPKTDAQAESTPAPVFEFEQPESPVEVAATPRKPAVVRSAVREEMEGRVAAFRAHQQRFDRERDRHFNSVLTGIRAAITDPSRPPTP